MGWVSCFSQGFAALLLFASQAHAGGIIPDDVIDPVGEEKLGSLVVKEPLGLTDKSMDYRLTYRGNEIKAGTSYRLVPGAGCLQLTAPAYLNYPLELCSVTIESKKVTVASLSGLRVRWDKSADNPLRVDIGPRPQLTVKWQNRPAVDKAFGQAWSGDGVTALVLPGHYTFSFNLPQLSNVETDLGAGQILTQDLTPTDQRAGVAVQAPAERRFPDPPLMPCESPERHFFLQRNAINTTVYWEPHPKIVLDKGTSSPTEQIEEFVNFALPVSTTLRAFPLSAGGVKHYEYVVNNISTRLDLKAGETVPLNMKRIDINDVWVDKEDGTGYFVQGNYSVFRRNVDTGRWDPVHRLSAGPNCMGPVGVGRNAFPTKTGIDVLPGLYRILVHYTTAEGTKVNEYTKDLTP